MKILLTSDWYKPAVNGVVTSICNLRKGLEERGHEVRIVTLSGSQHSYEKDGVIYVGSVSADLVYPGARLRVVRGRNWVEEICAWRPDIVHSNCEFSTFLFARQISVRLHIPLVHTYHTIYENYTHYFSPSKVWGRKVVALLSRKIAAKTDAMIAPTEKVSELLQGYGITTPIHVMSTGIELEPFMKAIDKTERITLRESLGIHENETVLVSIGRIAKEKNHEELIRMMNGLRKMPVRLLLVGDGPYRPELEKLTDSLDLREKVVFAGMISPEEVSRYYRAGDLFVSASTSETQGLTYIEALASGLPLLCHLDGSLKGIVKEGVNGWQYDSEEVFTEKVREYVSHPEMHQKMSRKAAEEGMRHSVPEFARNAEKIYRDVIAASYDERTQEASA